MNITKHAKLRYVQRIAGITDRQEALQYIAQNDPQVIDGVLKTFEHALFIWKGQVHDNITRNYYLRDDIILVTDTDNTAIVTLFRVDFGFPDAVNRQTLKSMLAELKKLQVKADRQREKSTADVERKQTEIDTVEAQIQAAEVQLSILKAKRDSLQQDVTVLNQELQLIEQEMTKIASSIVASVDYRTDLQEWKRNG